MRLSTLSRIPPCPGKSVPVSLIPDLRFIYDSRRSPIIPRKAIKRPMNIDCIIDILNSKYSNNITADIIEKIIPAKDPSNVLLGLTLGKAFLTPKNFPTK